MEPNKLETQFKEKLNSREIEPSEMAWDRLDAMLSVTEEKKTRRSFGWLYIAASILVLGTAGMFFFNQKKCILFIYSALHIVGAVTKTLKVIKVNSVATPLYIK